MPASSAALIKAGKRWLYFGHRWLGIILCVGFAVWFISGLVMVYIGFPYFRDDERVERGPQLAFEQVRVTPGAALAALGLKDFPEEMRLEMSGGAPVYRWRGEDGRDAVSAVDGRRIESVGTEDAARIVGAYAQAPVISTAPVERDQWTVTRAYNDVRPLFKVRIDDRARTDFYVSARTGEIVQNTTAKERFWNWLGAIPHWIYFEALRKHQEPWRQTVIWLSGAGILGGIAGIWIGLLRVRVKKRYASGSVSPYRGWMKWHHVVGLVGGVFVVTWVFSGWMSMSPFNALRGGESVAPLYRGEPRLDFPLPTSAAISAQEAVRELRFDHIGGRPLVVAVRGPEDISVLEADSGQPAVFNQTGIEALARSTMPANRLIETSLITTPDLYWYSHGERRTLPVLRLKFDDDLRTWLHIDPMTGALLSQSDEKRRLNRWLFNGLHSFDFPPLLAMRPLWDILIWVLSAAGLVVSVSGVVIGWRRLKRDLQRKPPRPAAKV